MTLEQSTEFWRTSDGYKSSHGMALRIGREVRSATESKKSKIEINVVPVNDSNRIVLTNGTQRFLAFALKLDPHSYEAPRLPLLHFQVWQCCSSAATPALALHVVPEPLDPNNGPINVFLVKRTDANLAKPASPANGDRLRFVGGADSARLNRGEWYRFVFRLRPEPQSAGQITMWLNGELALDYTGAWGYTPQPLSAPQAKYSIAARQGNYAVKLGIYRHAQETIQQIYLDSIRWGLSRDDVDPDGQ